MSRHPWDHKELLRTYKRGSGGCFGARRARHRRDLLPAGADEPALKEAPGITISTCRNTAGNLREDMGVGKVDLAIGLIPAPNGGFFQRRLFAQSYVCMLRKGHALDREKVSLAEFSAAEHLVVVSPGAPATARSTRSCGARASRGGSS